MSYVIKAELSSAAHPELGQMTAFFPIPDEEYDAVVERAEQLEMGDALRSDCQVDCVDSSYTVLSQLEGFPVTLDELDYLAKRLESFDDGEAAQFQAMAHKLCITGIRDFINLTFCCQQATVITDFSDLERAGREHRMNLNGGTMTVEAYNAIDGRRAALELIRSGAGTVTPYGVVYDNDMTLEEIYNGRQFPAYFYKAPLLALEVSTTKGADPEYLYLPASEQQVQRTLLRAGAEEPENARLRVELDELPEQVSAVLDLEHLEGGDLVGLNQLCRVLAPMKENDFKKLSAVVLLAMPVSAGEVRQLAENLDLFDFVPGVRTPEEYGEFMIQESGRFEYDENLEDFYDYRLYGERCVRTEGGQFNACGYVAYHGTMTLEELMQADPAEQCQQGQMML